MFALGGRIAVVTGAGSGIGRALAQTLAARGCRLALADIDEAALAQTAALAGGEPLLRKLDVADRAAVYAFADEVAARYGAVHLVINNAGVALSETIAEMRYEDFEWLMSINFWGVVYGTKAFLPRLLAQGDGTVVNISSVFGLIAIPTQGAYNAAKFAVRGFTEALRHELEGSGVRAISVHPGGIRTGIVRHGRIYRDPEGRTDKAAIDARFEQLARTSPEKAAETIVRGVERGNPRVLIGPDARMIDWIQRLFPVRYYKLLEAITLRGGNR
ncbi:MAG: SDR family oxidoreductase [Nevskia sp.]|nr:SDR family oxidoreductase [Nevskia sp.]